MTGLTLSERTVLASLAIRQGLSRAVAATRCVTGRLMPFANQPPERLVRAPQDIRTADATVASDIYAGTYFFAGQQVETEGRSIFDIDPPSDAFASMLHGFSWLRHLRAADKAIARAHARALIQQWEGRRRALSPVADTPEVAARRLLSLLQNAPFLLTDADAGFHRFFLRLIGREMRRLWRRRGLAREDLGGALVPMAVAAAAASTGAQKRLARSATSAMVGHLSHALLPDGAPVSRNGDDLAECLIDLLSVRQLLLACEVPVPGLLAKLVGRMFTMLRFLRMGDGLMGRFHGAGGVRPDHLAAILAHDSQRGELPQLSREAGMVRLQAGHSVVLMDLGGVPPPVMARHAHASGNAFEWSHGERMIVMNCGSPNLSRRDWLEAARHTAAHSTLGIEGVSSGTILGCDAPLLAPPRQRNADLLTGEDNEKGIENVCEGYKARFGRVHRRRLMLSGDGRTLSGLDALEDGSGKAGVFLRHRPLVRFHLASDTRVEELDMQRLLLRAGRLEIGFHASKGAVLVEESVLFSPLSGLKRTRQIVIDLSHTADTPVEWRFEVV